MGRLEKVVEEHFFRFYKIYFWIRSHLENSFSWKYKAEKSWSTCWQRLGSARLHGKLQGIVYIDDIIMMIILQIIIPQIIIYYKYTTSYHLAGSIRFLINFFLTP